MRIAVWYDLLAGGGKRALYDQVRGFLARGHEVEAWCSPVTEQDYLPLNALVREHVIPHRLMLPPKTFLGRCRPMHWNASVRLRAMHEHSRKCAEQINNGKFDLLFAAPTVFFSMPSIGRFVTIPRVVYLQEPLRWLYEAEPELAWAAPMWTSKDLFDLKFWRKALARRIRLSGVRITAREERRSAMAFDDILVNSFFSRESVKRAYGLDAKVCYLGVDTDKFVWRRQAREGFALSLGAFVPKKNAEFILQALAKVPEALRPKLVWIGETVFPEYLERMKRLAASAGVSFELKQRIGDCELIDLLNRTRLMLYAPRLEPFGYGPLEANACGTPVVAVAEGGMRETIQDGVNGILVEPDPAHMASAIQRLMSDDDLAKHLGHDAHSLVRAKWSLPAAVDRLEIRLNQTLTMVKENGSMNFPKSMVAPGRLGS